MLVCGAYDWLRKSNDYLHRRWRSEAARSTMKACKVGGYLLGGQRVELVRAKEAVDGTCFVYAPKGLSPGGPPPCSIAIETHSPGRLVEVAKRCADQRRQVALVNAASAYHVGGGFFDGGRHALEESICMQTTLFGSLCKAKEQAKAANLPGPQYASPAYGRGETPWRLHIPEDGVVVSPWVEVFRGGTADGYPFLPVVSTLRAVINVAMPNCNPDVRDAPCDRPPEDDAYRELLLRKFAAVLQACCEVGASALVVPDVGCGVYMNDPTAVGSALGQALRCPGLTAGLQELHLVGSAAFAAAAQDSYAGGAPRPPTTTFEVSGTSSAAL